MRGAILSAAILLAGCGGAERDASPKETPTSYYIRKADLYREAPNDICRARDAAFLQNLLRRVAAALPPGTAGFDFEDFNARQSIDGKGKEAVLRFRVTGRDGAPELMYAVGRFDERSCAIGRMSGGIGADPHDPRSTRTFEAP